MYVGFADLEKTYKRVNRKSLCQVLRMYNVVGKTLNCIKSMYLNNLTFTRVKHGESECFKIDKFVRQTWVMSLWLFNVYVDSNEGIENIGKENGIAISGVGEIIEIFWPIV